MIPLQCWQQWRWLDLQHCCWHFLTPAPALSRMPKVPGFSYTPPSGPSGGSGGAAGAGPATRPSLLPSRPSVSLSPSGGPGFVFVPRPDPISPIGGRQPNLGQLPPSQGFGTRQIITINTGASARQVQNTIAGASTRSSTSYLQSRSALNAKVGG